MEIIVNSFHFIWFYILYRTLEKILHFAFAFTFKAHIGHHNNIFIQLLHFEIWIDAKLVTNTHSHNYADNDTNQLIKINILYCRFRSSTLIFPYFHITKHQFPRYNRHNNNSFFEKVITTTKKWIINELEKKWKITKIHNVKN
jgi:hypothetical protein